MDVVPADAAPLAECNDVPLVTLDQIAAGEHAGEVVAIDVMPAVDMICTHRRCMHKDGSKVACCNRCGGEYQARLRDELLLRLDVGRCGGMDCNIHCEPFGRKPAHSYRFVGTNAFESRKSSEMYATSALHVQKYCSLDPP
jgi:hypothetical protein